MEAFLAGNNIGHLEVDFLARYEGTWWLIP